MPITNTSSLWTVFFQLSLQLPFACSWFWCLIHTCISMYLDLIQFILPLIRHENYAFVAFLMCTIVLLHWKSLDRSSRKRIRHSKDIFIHVRMIRRTRSQCFGWQLREAGYALLNMLAIWYRLYSWFFLFAYLSHESKSCNFVLCPVPTIVLSANILSASDADVTQSKLFIFNWR